MKVRRSQAHQPGGPGNLCARRARERAQRGPCRAPRSSCNCVPKHWLFDGCQGIRRRTLQTGAGASNQYHARSGPGFFACSLALPCACGLPCRASTTATAPWKAFVATQASVNASQYKRISGNARPRLSACIQFWNWCPWLQGPDCTCAWMSSQRDGPVILTCGRNALPVADFGLVHSSFQGSDRLLKDDWIPFYCRRWQEGAPKVRR